jgi:hypothetical protein
VSHASSMSHVSHISSYLMSHLSHIYPYVSSHVSCVSQYLVSHVSHDFVHSELLLLCDPETAVLSRSTDISWVKNLHGVIPQKTGNFNFINISVSQQTVNHYCSKIIQNRPTAYRNNLHFVLTKIKAIYTNKRTRIKNKLSHRSH